MQYTEFIHPEDAAALKALKAIPIDAPATQMEGCVHTIKKAYRKRAADEFIRVLSQSNAVMERAYNWLNQ